RGITTSSSPNTRLDALDSPTDAQGTVLKTIKKKELAMKIFATILTLAGLVLTNAATAQPVKPTIVLVHGAFADSSSWYGVIPILEKDGYHVIAAANPLRSVKGDADGVRSLLATIQTPVVLVGHSYGGMVISNAANGQSNVKAL